MEPRRERTLYEIASTFFAGVVICFAIAGMLVTALGDEGVGSSGFLICSVFLALGLGRLYLGLRRGGEKPGEQLRAAPEPSRTARRPGSRRFPRPRR